MKTKRVVGLISGGRSVDQDFSLMSDQGLTHAIDMNDELLGMTRSEAASGHLKRLAPSSRIRSGRR